MKRAMCENGHYYDADESTQCPFCLKGMPAINRNNSAPVNNNIPVPVPKAEKKGLFGALKRNKDKKKNLPEQDYRNINSGSAETGRSSSNTGMPDINMMLQINNSSVKSSGSNSYYGENTSDPVTVPESFVSNGDNHGNSLSSALNSAEVNRDDVKTVGFFGGSSMSGEPVVGWLVALSGGDRGNSFSLYSGKNLVGRSSAMDVVLVNDNKVSRERHTTVMYEPVTRKYYLLSSESGGMVYVNGSVLMDNYEMNDRDSFKVGDTTLMLVKLCGNDFSWEEI